MSHQPRKRFGQHFLKDPNILMEMIQCLALQKNDRVIEIGPGQGALTEFLLSQLDHLDVVELDRDLVSFLQTQFDPKKITIHAADALNFSYASLSKQPSDLRIVGNLPYNISTPLLFKLFSETQTIRDMHFMLQKEVVLRLTANVGSTDYGRLSVMSQYFCDNTDLFDVPPEAFDPPPRVNSSVVRLVPRNQYDLSAPQFQLFSDIVKEAFNYRRKKLGNALKKFVDAKQLANLDIDPDARPQDISVSVFIRIALAQPNKNDTQ